MAFNYSPRVITDGLVLYLDAANTRSYPGVGTTWTDISRSGINGTLTNGPTFNSENGGSIVFDGSNNYCSIPAIDVGKNFTVGIWFRPNATGRKLLFANSYTYAANKGFLFDIGNAGTDIFLSLGNDQQFRVSSAGYISANVWTYANATFDGTTIKLYINGTETTYTATSGTIATISYDTNPAFLGRWLNGGTSTFDFFAGRISNVSLYNRALTSTEIRQNYNATKTRFGR